MFNISFLGHLAQEVERTHAQVSTIKLHDAFDTVDTQQHSAQFSLIAKYHFHLQEQNTFILATSPNVILKFHL